MNDILWWGYLHDNGSIQVKRFFSEDDLDDALDSPFVARVVRPFSAKSREDAIAKMEDILNVNKI